MRSMSRTTRSGTSSAGRKGKRGERSPEGDVVDASGMNGFEVVPEDEIGERDGDDVRSCEKLVVLLDVNAELDEIDVVDVADEDS